MQPGQVLMLVPLNMILLIDTTNTTSGFPQSGLGMQLVDSIHIVQAGSSEAKYCFPCLLVTVPPHHSFATLPMLACSALVTSKWGIVDFAYNTPSDLYTFSNGLWTPTLESSQRVCQGDSLGSVLFALSVKPLYSTAIKDAADVTARLHTLISLVG